MKSEVLWHGQRYLMEWLDDTNFEDMENVTQSYGFVFDDEGKICIIDCNGYWCLPGGKPEEVDENFEHTLMREVDEEADLDIKNIRRIGCFRVKSLSDNCERKGIHHVLRYVADVDKIKEQTIDPANGKIPKRKFIDPEDFMKFVGWENGDFQIGKALEVYISDKVSQA